MKILLILFVIYLVISFSSTLTLMTNFSEYSKVYKSLGTMKFYRNQTQVYCYAFGEIEKPFVWFVNTGSFRLSYSAYLSSFFITYTCPYSYYWLLKYRRWFKNNVNINDLPNW